MKSHGIIVPDFLLIGAQKAGTAWLWTMLDQHPETDLSRIKEIHYFGGREIYDKGKDWYYSHFNELDSSKIIGEGSTTYLYDYIPFWYNKSDELVVDKTLPPIPELITSELPDIKIVAVLRDPVCRAVSAYHHCMRKLSYGSKVSPLLSLQKTATLFPKMRIVEYGYYARYIKLWQQFVPPEKMHILIFEEDVVQSSRKALVDLYKFLGLDPTFEPKNIRKRIHKSWIWPSIVVNYYTSPISRRLSKYLCKLVNRLEFLDRFSYSEKDIKFLRSKYLPEKEDLELLLNRNLDCWSYSK